MVDDHLLIREAVQAAVARLEPGATVLAASDSERGFAIAASAPDLELVLVDLNMPGLSGIPALKVWRSGCPDVPVVWSAEHRSDGACGDRRGRGGLHPEVRDEQGAVAWRINRSSLDIDGLN